MSHPDLSAIDPRLLSLDHGGMMPMSSLSKSAYLAGRQCPKLLWHLRNSPECFDSGGKEEVDPQIEQGRQVGILARELYPDGIEIPWKASVRDRLRLTREAIAEKFPIYEAALSAGGGYAQIDILSPAPGGRWDINEVKSSTSIKDEHLPDVAFQRHVCESAGLGIRSCRIIHINSNYRRQGTLNPSVLFTSVSVTRQTGAHRQGIEGEIRHLLRIARRRRCPAIDIGPHCSDPYICPLMDECWKFLPEHSVFDLYRGGDRPWNLYRQGVLNLDAIPKDYRLTAKQAIQVDCACGSRPHVAPVAIRRFLGALRYPLHLLDFETLAPAVPLFDGTGPYQQIPFQFSRHRVDRPGGKPRHIGWLAQGQADPRPALLDALHSALGPKGDIVAYNIGFEKARMRELAAGFPQHRRWLIKATGRLVDLLVPFRRFAYHHPCQHGSCSLKAVLPALTGKGYDNLAIADGTTAASEFLRITNGDVPAAERIRVRRQLEDYCRLDTLAMAWILEELERLAG